MKLRGFPELLLSILCVTVLAGCQQPATEVNRTAVPSPTAEVVDNAAIEAELLRIENDWPRVLREKDVAAVRRVEADDVVLIYPDGSTGTKEQDLKDVEAGSLTADKIEMTDLKVHVLDKDAAVVTGRTIVTNGRYKMPDGNTINITGQYRFADTFARRNGEWKMVTGVSVPLRQPIAAGSPSPAASPRASVAVSPAARTSPATTASPAATP